MNPFQQLQRDIEIAYAVERLVAIITLGLLIWAIVATVKAFNRWERRDEAKVKALQQIAAKLPAPQGADRNAHIPDFRATR